MTLSTGITKLSLLSFMQPAIKANTACVSVARTTRISNNVSLKFPNSPGTKISYQGFTIYLCVPNDRFINYTTPPAPQLEQQDSPPTVISNLIMALSDQAHTFYKPGHGQVRKEHHNHRN